MRLFALRGATTVERNTSDEILAATEKLMREIMSRNDLGPEDVVSCLFTLTEDLDAEFPAVAARSWASPGCRCCARARFRCRARCRASSAC